MPKIVIIGAGIVGCSLADELTERGYCDVIVIEKGKLCTPGGSTSHAPGVVFQTNGSRTMAQFAQQTVEKLHSLQHIGETCFLKVGSLELATTPQRLADLHRRAGLAMSVGIDARVISPEEALKLHPLLAGDKLLGALYVPDDGIARAVLADEVMGQRCISRGGQFIDGCEVIAIDQDALGIEGRRTVKLADTEIWVRPLADGSQAVVLLNRSEERRSIRLEWSVLHLPDYVTMEVRDLWLRQDRPKATSSLTAEVAPHAVSFLKLTIARKGKQKS